MLYYLYLFKTTWSPLNVLQYITFRAGGAALTSFFLVCFLGPLCIRTLRRHKIAQVLRPEGPPTHLAKSGTPTMGGLLILLSLLVSALLWVRLDQTFLWILVGTTLALGGLGIADDYEKLIRRHPAGISSRTKLVIQAILGIAVVAYLSIHPPNPAIPTSIHIPYTKSVLLDLGWMYYFLAILLIVGASNAVNLTDGLDGLAIGNLVLCASTYALFAYLAGHAKFSQYLRIIPVEGAGEITVYLAALVGAGLGFLWFNAYPAEVFMGDSSSLFLGGVLGTIAVLIRQELILLVVGGVFVLETLSVVLQMTSYKLRKGKRIFRMAPLHHHFELKGWPEPKVTVRLWIVGIVFSLIALGSLKLR
ncbi:MAG: phospho-N-acetylmuramoyl-pentapeptide-transferase [Elusimicrobia bacterium]|nr:phospho-N-acetylmuramoyl-pentapeptide-transferase [Elusimicrobiota bacterium]